MKRLTIKRGISSKNLPIKAFIRFNLLLENAYTNSKNFYLLKELIAMLNEFIASKKRKLLINNLIRFY